MFFVMARNFPWQQCGSEESTPCVRKPRIPELLFRAAKPTFIRVLLVLSTEANIIVAKKKQIKICISILVANDSFFFICLVSAVKWGQYFSLQTNDVLLFA